MSWKLDKVGLDDLLPIPKAQPGRHFTTGHHILGNLTSTQDVKYAQMSYGEHYRKKVEAALIFERQRVADLLAEQKKKALTRKSLVPTTTNSGRDKSRLQPRYDFGELRHHQRRCAAMLFGARKRGAHKLPILVQWAPKRRESYYLMSERVYNDRVLMKMRADAGDSPLNFDFANTDGDTDNLHEFQQFINKTSSDIKDLRFDSNYKDYTYYFDKEQKKSSEEKSARAEGENENEERELQEVLGSKSQPKLALDDHVTESNTDRIGSKSSEWSQQTEKRNEVRGLDPCDVKLSFGELPENFLVDRSSSTGDETSESRKGNFREKSTLNSRDELSSEDFPPSSQKMSEDNEYSSEFYSDFSTEGNYVETEMEEERNSDLPETGNKILPTTSRENLWKPENKHCKHAPQQESQEYHERLPKLLKTSELREKLPEKTSRQLERVGSHVDHNCMEPHKMAYERALTLARFRSLPFSPSFLSQKVSNLNNFSYFPNLSHGKKTLEKDDNNEYDDDEIDDKNDSKAKTKVLSTDQSGREAIFGNIDMDDFYVPDDELIYYIKPEELKNVVES